MNDLEYATFLTCVEVVRKMHPDWRYGQTVYNVMRAMRPDLEDHVIHTELDCFQLDNRAPRLMNWLRTGVPEVPARRP